MPKPNKQIIIDAIIKEIEKGKATDKICAAICRKFQFSERTFYNHFKKASEQHKIKQQAIKEEIAEVDKQAAIEARKKAIMTADERKEYLTRIANGEIKFKKPFIISGKIMEYPSEPDAIERMRAIAELNKMEGDYAPTKVANTDSKGNDVTPLTDKQVDKILEKIDGL
jgi:hypothetical protein